MTEKGEVRGVSPLEAKKLVDSGYSYVDVRSESEFRSGHPTGALNVPFLQSADGHASPHPDFLPLMQRLFAVDRALVVGCATGVRSLAAVALLARAGFTRIVEVRAGFEGKRSAFGELVEPGWRASGLPVSRGDDEGSFAHIARS